MKIDDSISYEFYAGFNVWTDSASDQRITGAVSEMMTMEIVQEEKASTLVGLASITLLAIQVMFW